MQTIEIAILIVLLAVLGLLVYVFFIRKDDTEDVASDTVLLLQQQLQNLERTMNERMSESNKLMQSSQQTQFSESRKLIQEINRDMNEQLMHVAKGVSEVTESNKQIFTIGEQLQNLEKVLKHQKQRGNLGEASLQLALENILDPTTYKLQYRFESGEAVDAVIFAKEGIIPVDAKFSLDNYQRLLDEEDEERIAVLQDEFKNDLKKRIDETAKYIKPKEGTLNFAFMYIPAEAIYYDLLVNEIGAKGRVKVNSRNLIDYAYRDKNVIIVSPTTFAAYLQSVLYGFRAFQFEEQAKDIRKNVELLSRHLLAYEEYFKKLGNALGTTVNHYNHAQKELGKVDKDVMKITDEKMGIEVELLEKPQKEEE
ncbi:MAG: DNA recombination protein RmuC [Candidatus Pacebacteria bacterium]|jgi:DNA recombination protein RmuC|nr:DNA recombination protein RmuC [Candidatus Paceibacterota bacterium]